MPQPKMLITHSLLNAWNYLYKTDDEYYDNAYESFIQTLNRADTPPTPSMLNGLAFEKAVSDIIFKRALKHTDKWSTGANEIADIIIENCTLEQAKVYKDVTINGIDYLMYGVIDWLGGGTIYDIKYKHNISNYNVGDYCDGTQHRMYLSIIDTADKFVYLISNGQKVYKETYTRKESRPIEQDIINLENWLKLHNLWDIYVEKWHARG